jgi:type IX secretion system PorP/SprF family membrane protein
MIHKRKYRKGFISLLLIIFYNTITYAQQVPHYTQYLYNMQVLNPAFVGANSDLSISLLSRQQWVGVEGAPETKTFSINGRTFRGLGFGVTIINDKLGLANSTNINLDASYTISTSQYGRVSFGLKGGLTFFSNNLSNGTTPDNDFNPSTSGKFPNIGLGALYYNDKFFVGLSIPNILKSSQFKTLETFNIAEEVNNSNYFLATGLIYKLSEDFTFKPATIIKYTPTLPVSIDINSNIIYKNKLETGLSYRYKNSISALFAIIFKEKFRVGYSYDYKLSNYGTNLSSHEIIIRFDLDLKRNTRWLFHNKCYF